MTRIVSEGPDTAPHDTAQDEKQMSVREPFRSVLIVGAGASRAEALARRARRPQRPPLDTDFFEIAEQHDTASHRAVVQRFVAEQFGIEPFVHPRPRMEEVFGLVYTSTLGSQLPEGATHAFASLCRIYATVIAETTNWLRPSPKGPLCRLIRSLADGGPMTVISFNQDILVEKALYALARSSPGVKWNPSSGYAIDFASLSAPGASFGGALFEVKPVRTPSDPLVLKPHGSLNWYVTTLRDDRVPSRLPRNKPIHCTRRQELSTAMTYTRPTKSGRGRKRWYTWPIIVPPVVEKGAFLGQALERVWAGARKALIEAQQVVVYGYSLPDADAQGRAFLLRARTAMPARPVLVTINPDSAAAMRVAAVLSPRAHLICDSVSDFLLEVRRLRGIQG